MMQSEMGELTARFSKADTEKETRFNRACAVVGKSKSEILRDLAMAFADEILGPASTPLSRSAKKVGSNLIVSK